MPREVAIKRQYLRLMRSVILGVGIIAIVILLLDIGILGFSGVYNFKIKGQEQEITQKMDGQTKADVLSIISQKGLYRQQIIEELDKRTVKVSDLTNKISGIIPKNVSVTELSIVKGEITIGGTSDTEESALDFYYNLKKSELGGDVQFEKLEGTIGDVEGFNFVFGFQLKNTGSDSNESK